MRAIVFSKWPSDQFEYKFGEKLRRRGIEIVDVLDPDKTSIPDTNKEVDAYISLCELMSAGANHDIKKAARSSGVFYVALERQSARWDAILTPIEEKVRANAALREQLKQNPPQPKVVHVVKEEPPPDSKTALETEKLVLEQELGVAQQKIKELETLMEGTDTELKQARETIATLEHEVTDQSRKVLLLEDAQRGTQELQKEVIAGRERIRELEVHAGNLKAELDMRRKELITAGEEFVALQKTHEKVAAELQELKAAYERDGNAYDQLLEAKQKLQDEIDLLKQQSRPLRPPTPVKKVSDLRELVKAVQTMLRFGQLSTSDALDKIFKFAEEES